MTCGYCEHHNPSEASRCEKCGRKLSGIGLTLVAESYGVAYGNAAPQLRSRLDIDPQPRRDNREEARREEARREEAREDDLRLPRQGNLFPVQEARRVIPFESISPEAASLVRSTAQRNTKARGHRRLAQRLGLGGDAENSTESQQRLTFPEDKRQVAKVETIRYTNAPVALPTQRMMAAAYDAAMILIAVGLLVTIHQLAGAEFAFGNLHLGVYASLIAVVTLFYRLLWAMGNGDSPGTKAVGLRLLNFDGYIPTREQRFMRVFSSLISTAALGMGLAWCLFDEERLTWHDEMSGTFPSPRMEE